MGELEGELDNPINKEERLSELTMENRDEILDRVNEHLEPVIRHIDKSSKVVNMLLDIIRHTVVYLPIEEKASMLNKLNEVFGFIKDNQ